jgi:hypothetical protein
VLDLLERDAQPERHWHALYLLARASTALGDHRVALDSVLKACKVARDEGSAELFGRGVLLLDPRYHITTGGTEVAKLQAEALERLSESASIERPLLLAASIAYAVESGSTSLTLEEITEHEEEAIAIADATSDPRAQLGTRASLARARAGLPDATRQLDLAAAIEERVLAPPASLERRITDSLVSALRETAISSQAEAHAKLANRANFDACLERHIVVAQRAPSSVNRGWESFISGLQPFIDGNLDDAEALTLAAQRVGSADPSLTAAIFDRLLRIAWLRRDDDAVDERLGQAALFEDAYPQVRAMRAMVAAERGRETEARSLARQLLRDGGTQLPWNGGRPRILHDLAAVAAYTNDTASAELLLPLLRPYVGEMLTSYLISVEGAAETSAAIIEFVLGRTREARLHLQAGLELEEQFGAALSAAATRAWQVQLAGAARRTPAT